MVNLLKYIVKDIMMLGDYIEDYMKYRKYNYNNPLIKSEDSMQAKLFRQTHTIEKGMSISAPRRGFGEKKIQELMNMLDEYIVRGYSTESTAFLNSVNVMFNYIEFQKNLGYFNETLFIDVERFRDYYSSDYDCGIVSISNEDLKKQSESSFPLFFQSRHSVRQFADNAVEREMIKKAIKLAQKAPTACNRQAYKVYMYNDEKVNYDIGNIIAGNTGFEKDVRNYLIVVANISSFYDSFERNQLYIEGGIFAMALVEALHFYGIASCILQYGETAKREKKIRSVCTNIALNEKIILFIAIGNYKENVVYAVSHRKSLEEVYVVK